MKTNRDKFANCYALIWLLSNIIVYLITKDAGWVLLSTYLFLFIMALIVLHSKKNEKFKNWLDK
nr:MAG TPA: hypothetical protein [Caudoviricetes sp.]